MAKKKKPLLIRIGESLVDPSDVSCIQRIRTKTDLYVIRLKSQPNQEFPVWAKERDLAVLLEQFEIVDGD